MKQIFSEIMRPEENTGFTPSEPDDDTFLLETQQNYPGTIPTFADENESSGTTLLTQEENLQANEEIPEPPSEGSVWDIFEQEQTSSQIAPENIENADIEATVSTTPQDNQFQIQEIEEKATENEYLFADDIEIANEKLEESEQLADSIAQVETETEIPENIASLELDSSFIEELEKEIEKNKAKKELVEILEEETPDNTSDQSFDSEEENPSLFVVLSDIDTENTSNIPDDEKPVTGELIEVFEETNKEQFSENLNNTDKKKSKVNNLEDSKDSVGSVDKEKQTRFASLIKYSAIFLLFAISGIALYYIWDNFGYDKINLISSKLFGSKSEKEIIKHTKDTKSMDATHTAEVNQVKEQAKPDTQEPIKNDQTDNKEISKQITTEEPKVIQKQEIKEKSKPEIATNIRSDEIKPEPKKKTVENEPKKNVTNASDNSLKSNTKKVAKEEIYTIQIYATPSLEDAQNWLKEIKMRYNIDAYISPQIIRDRQWYRVRYGYFSSMEEATATAMKFGFSQSWIDRIK